MKNAIEFQTQEINLEMKLEIGYNNYNNNRLLYISDNEKLIMMVEAKLFSIILWFSWSFYPARHQQFVKGNTQRRLHNYLRSILAAE